MTPTVKTITLAGAFAAIAVLAVLGWARKPVAPATPYGTMTQYAEPANLSTPVQTASTSYQNAPTGGYPEPTAAGNCVQPGEYGYVTPAYANRYGVRTVRPRIVEQRVVQTVYQNPRITRRGRSTGKSVAIVAGTAGVGAAIGALAGGGKGAGIGALAGGGAGFVYDRLTHRR
ncbi:MAG TPA: hypothetical protein VM120_19730 [Bryobacteraceae bacterium]|nr:hypothetical protein [Bryobacteraceae bacterium]